MKQFLFISGLVLSGALLGIPRLSGQGGMPLRVSLFSESTSIPFTQVLPRPLHPGIQVGTKFPWKETNWIRLYPTINVGYLFHRKLFQGIYINTELGVDLKLVAGLNLKTALGVGYLHTFTTRREFQFENGAYRSNPDQGNSRLMPSLSLGVGYRFNSDDSAATEIFFLHQTWLEYPYSPGFIPLMSHTSMHLGIEFYPFK